MTNVISVTNYDDFKVVLKPLVAKATIYWFLQDTTFRTVAVALDMSYALFLTGLTSKPDSFDTDFSEAIQVTTAIVAATDSFQV